MHTCNLIFFKPQPVVIFRFLYIKKHTGTALTSTVTHQYHLTDFFFFKTVSILIQNNILDSDFAIFQYTVMKMSLFYIIQINSDCISISIFYV